MFFGGKRMRKIMIFFAIICVLMLGSCSNVKDDPISLAKSYDAKEYAVKMFVDDEEIKEFADELEVRSKGIYCIVAVAPNNGDDDDKMGVYIYCNDNDSAEKMVEDLEQYAKNNEDFKEEILRQIVDRKGNVVFIGSEDTWEDNQ
jgi:hypothetical protein